jgi:hypothetical protein
MFFSNNKQLKIETQEQKTKYFLYINMLKSTQPMTCCNTIMVEKAKIIAK